MIASFQHIGSRVHQEDSYHIDSDRMLFIVCDGVGGAEAGETASAHVVQSIITSLSQYKVMPICRNSISEAILKAQISLNKLAAARGNMGKAGTTLALLHIYGSIAITAHMGDSKIILLKSGSTTPWTTKDHSTVQELYDAGILKSEEEMRKHPLKNRITNALFVGQDPQKMHIASHELQHVSAGDLFIVCSDGVFESYSPVQLATILSSSKTNQIECISKTVKENSKDNSTMIAIRL